MEVKNCLEAIGGNLLSGDKNKVFRGVSIDSRTLIENELFICICGDQFNGHDFIKEAQNKKASAIVLSDRSGMASKSNMAPSVIHVDDTLKALQELARFHRSQMSVKVIGVTGTNGKSTTKEMTASIIEKKFRDKKIVSTKFLSLSIIGSISFIVPEVVKNELVKKCLQDKTINLKYFEYQKPIHELLFSHSF